MFDNKHGGNEIKRKAKYVINGIIIQIKKEGEDNENECTISTILKNDVIRVMWIIII